MHFLVDKNDTCDPRRHALSRINPPQNNTQHTHNTKENKTQTYSLFHHSDQFDFVSSLWCIDSVREPLCEPNCVCIFVLRNTSGPRVKFVDS